MDEREREVFLKEADECPCCRMMAEMEMGAWGIPGETLKERGVRVASPDEVPDARLADELWRLIEGLAAIHVYVENTDHMNDRELYVTLYDEILNEVMFMSPDDPDGATHISFTSSGSEEDTEAWLRYYADDETREEWKRDFPDFEMPPKARPPFDRDRLLPTRETSKEAGH